MMLDIGTAYVEHGPLVRNWLRRNADSRFSYEDIEDLVSETFLRACRASPRYQDRGHKVTTWLVQIARNLLTDEVRRRQARPPMVALLDVDTTSEMGSVETATDLEAVLWRLTAEQRAVVAARYGLGLPHGDTAARLGLTLEAVKHCHVRALRRLRSILEAA